VDAGKVFTDRHTTRSPNEKMSELSASGYEPEHL